MNILISNDDGIGAVGIKALVDELSSKHSLTVVAPAIQQSAVSKALTLYSPLRAERVTLSGHEEIEAFAVMGTPVDCIRLGLGNLISQKPDLVISGINVGHNVGTDTLYSGTCAAAQEAAIRGFNSLALSCCSFKPRHMDTAAKVGARMIEYIKKLPPPFGVFYNVNIPDLPFEELKGIKRARLGIVRYEDEYIRRVDTIGRDYYWAPRQKINDLKNEDTDERWVFEGYVTITPLSYNNDVKSLVLEGIDETLA
ncbi:MAG: 5'/3'-nucleotidase SurE [Clostridia bacterium]|nr:5'/3'-nucleotidase SurE [Clostridia bacterium]